MIYETLTLDQLQNRAPNAYHRGDCGIPETPEQFFSVQYDNHTGKGWWNGFETTDQAEAEAEIARWKKMGSTNDMRIVVVVAPKPEPKPTQEQELPEAIQAVLRKADERKQAEAPRTVADEVREIVAEFRREEQTPRSTFDSYVAPKTIYLDFNKVTGRYEARVNGRLYCIEGATFTKRLSHECGPSDDAEHVAAWLLKLSNWKFAGRASGAYIE